MKPVTSPVSFPDIEKSVLRLWEQKKIPEKGLSANLGAKRFVFYDGPPFATGLPHYGHILAGTLKDIVPRYWVMRGRHVERRWGWDCHGLPVEFEMENELGLSGRADVEKYGVAKFNEACRGIVQRYAREWEQIITRTGRWADFKNSYRTMDPTFMESVWWVFQQLWNKGLIYEGYRVMPYSWRISTPLSNFEASLNYKEVQDPALTVKFRADSKPYFYLGWTTTPWTLPSNLALAVNPDVEYLEIRDADTQEHYILAEPCLPHYYKSPEQYSVVRKTKGHTLEGDTYEPLFSYFVDKKQAGAFKLVLADYVSPADGTGIVHTAPAFGEDDFQTSQRYRLPIVNPVDDAGKFTIEVPDYVGQYVKDADKQIIKDLKARNLVFRHETIVHNYPFCWRSDTPLIYRAIPAWFVKIEPIKENLLKNNQLTRWVPEHLRDGRFGNWLENARDWNISRNRFWGTPLPIWRCECGNKICVGSMAELEKLSSQKPSDIHKHFVDGITLPCPQCKKTMHRISEVLDCWFESGSMPYGQCHYPFENKQNFEANFPADFIAEGIDQTRGWFYTLCVLSSALFDKPPFRNVIVNGLVLAEDGKKMSKRLKNYPDPKYILDTYGADALRAYLMTSPASHAEDFNFSESAIKEIVRTVLLPYWNAHSFFVTYAIADGWNPSRFKHSALESLSNDLDRWIVSRLNSLIRLVDIRMEAYHLYEVIPSVIRFIDELTNWYIRLNRRRFWSDEKSPDKEAAYCTLYYVLCEFSKTLAPILPFITEEVYQNLEAGPGQPDSIHLTHWPQVESQRILESLEKEMVLVEQVVSLARNLRSQYKIKIRQPLKSLLLITRNEADRKTIDHYRAILSQELNVKEVKSTSDEKNWVRLTAKPNAKILGPRLGTKMQAYIQKIRELPPERVKELETSGSILLDGETIGIQDVTIERQSKEEGVIQSVGEITVWLDTKIDESLVREGRAREFVNRVQKLRKEKGFEVTDRIQIYYECPKELEQGIQEFRDYIAEETLATHMKTLTPALSSTEDEIDGFRFKLHIEKR